MSRFDLLFFDLDDTLLSPDHCTVSPRNRRALQAAKSAGTRLAVSTGRCLKLVPESLWELDFCYAVTSNGGGVYDWEARQKIGGFALSPSSARAAWDVLRPEAEMIEWFADGEILLDPESALRAASHGSPPWHRPWLNENPQAMAGKFEAFWAAGAPGLEKINLTQWAPQAVRRAREKLEKTGLFALSSSVDQGRSLEINEARCSKGTAIRWLCQRLNVPLARTAAFGDGDNDLEMLQTVGCGVAMDNASERVKRAANAIALPSAQDGVAAWMEREVLA